MTGRVYKRFSGPAQLTGTAATLYTVPAGTRARILNVHASNGSGSSADMTLSIGTDATGTRLYDGHPIASHDVLDEHEVPFDLAAGEVLQGWAVMNSIYSQNWDVDLGSPYESHAASRVTDPVYEGAGALRLAPTADTAYWRKLAPATTDVMVMRAYIRFATLPSVDLPRLLTTYVDGVGEAGIGYDQSEGKLACAQDGGMATAGGPVIATNTWYRIDLKIDATGTTWTVDAQVDGQALAQNSLAQETAGGLMDYRLGDFATLHTAEYFYDSFAVSHTATDYPLRTITLTVNGYEEPV